ncbi:MAG: antitoxin [Deinococcota bacterium]
MKTLQSDRMSISIAKPLISFIERYRVRHKLKTKSEVVEHAIKALRDRELSYQYQQGMKELTSEDFEFMDAVVGDGILPEDDL